jgi:folate-dependent phosphoribosylglycinamide formyltransferase PurN
LSGIILLMDNSDLSRIIYHALTKEFTLDAVIRETKIERSSFIRKRLRKLGWRILLGQILFVKCVVPLLRRGARKRRSEILQQHGMNEDLLPIGQVTDVRSVNDIEVSALLKRLAPKVVVVNGTRILNEELLQSTDAFFLNIHVGITPLYRGVHGGYWALVSGDQEHCGVTIHKIDKGIDTGAIIEQTIIVPTKADNFSTYPLLQIAAAIPFLKQVIRDAIDGNLKTRPAPDGKSRLWTHPTISQYLKNRFAHSVR